MTAHKPTRIIDIIVGRDVGHHAGPYPEALLPGPADYVGYFINEFHEELVFVQKPGEPTGLLVHSDCGWDPQPVRKGRCVDLILDGQERDWLACCWKASAGLRGGDAGLGPDLSIDRLLSVLSGEDRGEADKLVRAAMQAGEAPVIFRALGVDVDEATCKHCEQRIAKGVSPSKSREWVHVDGLVRGCLAASRARNGNIDDDRDAALKISWKAIPLG